LEALEQLPTEPATVEACAARLDDEDPLVRAAAVGVLAALDPRARTTLAHAVGDPHAGVRRRLGQVSRVLDGGDIVILLRDEDADVRTATLAGLAHGRRPDLSPSIAASLHDPSWHVRAAACDALGTGGERASATALVPALVDAHPMVRGRALVALERLLGDGLDDALVARLDDAPASLRRAIVEILGRHGCAAELARRELDSDADVRLAVVHALEGSASHAAGGTLRLLAGDEDPAVRSAATLAVEAAGDART
jgi:HEAT repeat protein